MTTSFTFKWISNDDYDAYQKGTTILIGDKNDETEVFKTAAEAEDYGQVVLDGTSSDRAFDLMRNAGTILIEAVEV